jgi:hypothetical protein
MKEQKATEGDKDGKVEGEATKVIAGRKCLVEGRVKLVCGLLFKDTIFYGGELWVVFSGLPSLVCLVSRVVLLAELCK